LARSSQTIVAIEHCWVLLGFHQGPFWFARRQWPTRGEPETVRFDAQRVLQREEQHGDIIGFYHTHPAGPQSPSQRDVRTMRAWCSSFKKHLLCIIESPGSIVAYRFDDDESAGLRLAACELFPRGVVVVADEVIDGDQS